jgi:hypothetical protein
MDEREKLFASKAMILFCDAYKALTGESANKMLEGRMHFDVELRPQSGSAKITNYMVSSEAKNFLLACENYAHERLLHYIGAHSNPSCALKMQNECESLAASKGKGAHEARIAYDELKANIDRLCENKAEAYLKNDEPKGFLQRLFGSRERPGHSQGH